jgi:hypothetical protein
MERNSVDIDTFLHYLTMACVPSTCFDRHPIPNKYIGQPEGQDCKTLKKKYFVVGQP